MRKVLASVFVLFGSITLYGQTEVLPPGIEVLKFNWSKERIGWETNPFNSTGDSFYTMRDRIAMERRQRSALEERNIRAAKEEQTKPPPPPRYVFSYKVWLSNSGKAVKEIDWDYVFTDASTGEEVGRREFTSVESVGAGKRKELSVLVSSPPTQLISVYALGKNERQGLIEKVVLLRILYADNTVWTTPTTP